MADNVGVTTGVDADIATDEIGGVHYQKIKIALGAENALDLILDSGQQTMSGSVPVAIASDQSAIPVTVSGVTSPTTLAEGRKVVAAAGTAEALAGSTACKWVMLTAETDNTGIVVVGGAGVIAALGTRVGNPLYAGDSVSILIDNLADIFLDVTVSGDGVTYTYAN